MYSFYKPKSIALAITAVTTFDPPKDMSSFGDEPISEMIDGPIQCGSSESIRKAWAMTNLSSKMSSGGVFKISVSGNIDDKVINLEFNTLEHFKSFLEEQGFRVANTRMIQPVTDEAQSSSPSFGSL